MGFIANLAKGNKEAFPGQNQGRVIWDRTFGRTKEGDESRFPRVRRPMPGGAWGRSITSSSAAQVRLIQALRSMAPGGWSDDRWGETQHWSDVRYLAGHRIGEQMLQAEFEVFHKIGPGKDDKKPVLPDDPPIGDRHVSPYRLVEVLNHPNNDDTFGELLYAAHQQLMLTGMFLCWMLPSELGTPLELYPIPTAIAIPQPAINPDYPDGYYRIQPVYPYGPFSSYPTPSTSVGAPIDARWMLRVKYTHPLLRYDGWSPQTALKLELDTTQQMNESRWHTLKRVIDPSAVLKCVGPGSEGIQGFPEAEIERMLAEIENEKQGTGNVGKLFIPPPGWDLEPWNSNLRDLQYTEGWDQLVSFAMAALGISKEAAGMIGTTAYAQLYAALKQLHWLTLTPLCYRIASKFTQRLAPFFGDNLIVEIKPPKIDDHEVTFARIQTLQGAVAITKGEVRKACDMPLTGEEWEQDMAGDPSPKMQEQMQNEQQQEQEAMQAEQEGDGEAREHEAAMKDGDHKHEQTLREAELSHESEMQDGKLSHEAEMRDGELSHEEQMQESERSHEIEMQREKLDLEREKLDRQIELQDGKMSHEQSMQMEKLDREEEKLDAEQEQERERMGHEENLQDGKLRHDQEVQGGKMEHEAQMQDGKMSHEDRLQRGKMSQEQRLQQDKQGHERVMKRGDQRHQQVMKQSELASKDQNAMRDRQLERQRPRPGKLGRGALGPRMKSIYEQVREAVGGGEEEERPVTKPPVGRIGAKSLRDKYRRHVSNGRH